jgi:hypothetical protein
VEHPAAGHVLEEEISGEIHGEMQGGMEIRRKKNSKMVLFLSYSLLSSILFFFLFGSNLDIMSGLRNCCSEFAKEYNFESGNVNFSNKIFYQGC